MTNRIKFYGIPVEGGQHSGRFPWNDSFDKLVEELKKAKNSWVDAQVDKEDYQDIIFDPDKDQKSIVVTMHIDEYSRRSCDWYEREFIISFKNDAVIGIEEVDDNGEIVVLKTFKNISEDIFSYMNSMTLDSEYHHS